MKLEDSGERREFTTGAVRDKAAGKGRCDLLPLDVLSKFLGRPVLKNIHDYIYSGDTTHLLDAVDAFIADKYGASYSNDLVMIEVAKHFEAGAEKYGERNWEQGLPVSWYIDSGVRHLLQYYGACTNELHHRAFLWNMLCAVSTHEHFPELRDLPFNTVKETTHD